MSIDNNNTERESKVLELYNNQGKTTREIAKEQRISLRDISLILKKHGVNHGLAMIDDDDDNKKTHSNNEKATQAYKLFSEQGVISESEFQQMKQDLLKRTR